MGAREARREAARRNGGKPRERCKAGSRKGSEPRKGSVTGVGTRIRLEMVRGASRWLPWSRRGRLGPGLSDTTPARCQRPIVDVAPRSTGGFGRTVTRGCVASGPMSDALCRRGAAGATGPLLAAPLHSPCLGNGREGPIRRRSSGNLDQRREAQSLAGRSPAATWRFSSAWTRARSSGCVTPMQRPWAGSTRERAGGQGFAHHLGQEHLGLLGGVGGGIHGGLERLVEGRGEAPEVHGDPGVAGELGRLPAVAGHEAPLGCPCHLAPLVHAEERAVVGRRGRCPG